ncbi:colicin V family bacteriocin [Salmonella enterica]|nr:colicin V family bacteriocin [Salmonella enterica]
MIELSTSVLSSVSGAGDINWVQAGRDVVTTGAAIAGGSFGAGLAGPVGAAVAGTAAASAAGALYDAAGNPPSKPENIPSDAWNYAEGRLCEWSVLNLNDVCK